MKITPDMPREPGSTVEWSGALLDLADFQDDDETGVKVGIATDYSRGVARVRIKVDSYSFRCRSVWLNAEDAEGLAQLIAAKAAELRKAEAEGAAA